jgi:hypothetical protein
LRACWIVKTGSLATVSCFGLTQILKKRQRAAQHNSRQTGSCAYYASGNTLTRMRSPAFSEGDAVMKNRVRNQAIVAVAGAIGLCAVASAQDRVSDYTAADGTHVTVVSGQPADRSYGPKPSFEQLDANHDGIVTREEAQAFLPLLNDYDNLVHHVAGITPRMYARWDYH